MMKRAWLLLLLSLACVPALAGELRVVVVRHAEKANDHPRDPGLSVAGQARAHALDELLKHEPVVAVYATQYRRTQLTAAAVAGRRSLPVRVRAGGESAASLAGRIRAEHAAGTVLVVGHSNTVPALVAELAGESVAAIGEDEFDRYYIISLPPIGPPRLQAGTYPPRIALRTP